MNIIKRNGSEAVFEKAKILAAVGKANASVQEKDRIPDVLAERVAERVTARCAGLRRAPSVEEVQDYVEEALQAVGAYELSRHYIRYRHQRELARKANTTDANVLALIDCNNEEVKQENSNKNPAVNSVQRDYMAGEVSKDLSRRILLPPEVVEAHEQGIIHFHDMDYYAQRMHNCDLVNLEDMLQNGTVISGTMIDRPHSFSTACNIATQIIAQVASNQYGGQSISLAHLAPFVEVSRQKIRKELAEETGGISMPDERFDEIVERRVRKEIEKGVQTIQYQVVTLMTTNGQAPFITVFMYLGEAKDERTRSDLAAVIEEVLKQRILGVKNEKGAYVAPAFPKLVYVLEERNAKPDSPYWYLTELAARCTAKRMVPDYISEKIMLKNKVDAKGDGNCYTCMGCRSFLTPYLDAFWEILGERLELCHRALQCRHRRLEGTLSDAAPILWQHGALARLKRGERIDALLHGGYSTISLGYAGLWECVYALTGWKLTEPEGEKLGLEIMRKLNEYTAKWKAAENIDYSLYGTPLESTTYRFAKCLQRRFGIIAGVTDRNYVTNSYHVHVTEKIDAFSKLALEAKFQNLSPGGAISYVEVPNLPNNIPAVLSLVRFIYDNIMYAELNTKSDYCQRCGFDGESEIGDDENGKLVWRCPKCGNVDQSTMNVARRTCGYIGSQFWNQGRTQEIRDRVMHLD